MIAKITGKLIDIFPGFIILENNGIGYRVEGSFPNFLIGDEITLYIYHHIREQEQRLFGFISKNEFILFQRLLQVSGIGPKGAMSLIESVGVESIVNAIISDSVIALKAPGIGTKTAQRLIIDLKNKVDDLNVNVSNEYIIDKEQDLKNQEEISDALKNLGYFTSEINSILKSIDFDKNISQADIIKQALALLKRSKS